MSDGPPPFDYADVRAAVESGVFIAFAAGTHPGGEPGLVWLAAPLDVRSKAVAYSSSTIVRAAQGVGTIAHLRQHARRHGFTPA